MIDRKFHLVVASLCQPEKPDGSPMNLTKKIKISSETFNPWSSNDAKVFLAILQAVRYIKRPKMTRGHSGTDIFVLYAVAAN